MDELERRWPDPDRRDGALEQLQAMVDLTKMPQDWHPDRRRDWSALTATECRVLEARSRGLGNRGTAEVTGLPLESVKYCLRNAARVLGAKDATHAVAEALRQGLIK